MAELTDRENLLLNTFMYIKGSDRKLEIIKNIKKLEIELKENADTMLSGRVKNNYALEVLKEMREYPNLINLKAVAGIDNGVRAACFVNVKDNESIIAIRGTGGIGESWFDNAMGSYLEDTDIQKEAKKFFDKVNIDYKIKYITGHSKGGNIAQYITIVCKNNIKKCSSYDGQGFSNEFCNKYKKEIIENRNKIELIASDKDYINGLLTQVSDKCKYIKTNGIENPHTTKELLDKSLYENGEFKKEKIGEQNIYIKSMFKMINKSNDFSIESRKRLTNRIGIILGYTIGKDSEDFEKIIDINREYESQYKNTEVMGKAILNVMKIKKIIREIKEEIRKEMKNN